MVWEAGARNAGFSTAERPWMRIGPDHPAKAVDRQTDDEASLLALYRRLLSWRRSLPAFAESRVELLDLDPMVLAKTIAAGEREVCCLFNFAGRPASVPAPSGRSWSETCVLGEGAQLSGQQVRLEPYGFAVFDNEDRL
jgi:alpha-glucosidase